MVLLCGCGMNAWAEERSTGIDESSIGVRWEILVRAMMREGLWQLLLAMEEEAGG